MTDITSFIETARSYLRPVLDRSGAVLYSACHTLRPGPVYLLGLNPGGDPVQITSTIAGSLKGLPDKTENSYTDENWGLRDGKEVKSPLQTRLQLLAKSLNLSLQDICASNLIFMRSRSAAGIDFRADAETCWPVHEQILDIVQPSLVITFGNSERSPYAFLRDKLPHRAGEETCDSGHGTWKCRGFEGEWRGKRLYVAGLPHLSRYSPLRDAENVREEVLNWLLPHVAG